ncbi:ribosome silencing factor [Deltaproteobacteria bacterium Smac51]|nr:ribosome silencing factor [Deltaproteobacteria bacterium Smac51]
MAKTAAPKAPAKTKAATAKTAPTKAGSVVVKPKATKPAAPKTGGRSKVKGPAPANLAQIVALAASEHKLINPVLLDLTGLSSVADWFFIGTAENARQMGAVADKIARRARDHGVRTLGQEGQSGGHWALVDLGDVIVHIFSPEARELYDLEGLWADAPRQGPDFPAKS